jgi:hypothetical protein
VKAPAHGNACIDDNCLVELVVAAAPNGCTHIDIADSRSHRSEFFE